VDAARARRSEKRGGAGLGDPRKAKVVEMRFFGGLRKRLPRCWKSRSKAMRDWKLARAWLVRETAK
jgi:hypothetical protein